MNNHERLNEQGEKIVLELSEKLLEFLDKHVPDTEYTHINMCLNVLTATLFRISNTYLPDMEDKINFANTISHSLIINYQNSL